MKITNTLIAQLVSNAKASHEEEWAYHIATGELFEMIIDARGLRSEYDGLNADDYADKSYTSEEMKEASEAISTVMPVDYSEQTSALMREDNLSETFATHPNMDAASANKIDSLISELVETVKNSTVDVFSAQVITRKLVG